MSLSAVPSMISVASLATLEAASSSLKQSRTNLGRAAALREILAYSGTVSKEADYILSGYSEHLESLFESVQHVATRAQVSNPLPGVCYASFSLWLHARIPTAVLLASSLLSYQISTSLESP